MLLQYYLLLCLIFFIIRVLKVNFINNGNIYIQIRDNSTLARFFCALRTYPPYGVFGCAFFVYLSTLLYFPLKGVGS